MRHAFVFETCESRKLFSASPTKLPADTQVIGPSAGLAAAAATPSFSNLTTVSKANGDTNPNLAADRDTPIKLTINVADSGGGIDATRLLRVAVRITNMATGHVLMSGDPNSELQKVKTSGGGDVLLIQTKEPLDANTTYKVEVNGSYTSSANFIRDVDGHAFDAFSGQFTTGSYLPMANPNINFSQTVQTAAGTKPFIATTIGPDHKLYASTSDGFIYRYTIGSDGSLSGEQEIDTIRTNNGGARIITGITFDPASTASNLVLWVSHSQYRFGNDPMGSDDVQKYANNFTGKISRISGTDLQNYEDIIVHIPRSVKDHQNNQLVFDPKGKAVYFGVAAMNAMGAADSVWGNRVENIYSATIMQLRLGSGPTGVNTYMHAHGPVDLMIDGNPDMATGLVAGTTHYNIFKGTNPLRIYADGVRNDFDLVFASNGHLYAGINGSSAGGNTPGTPTDLSTVPTQNRPDKDVKGTTYTGPAVDALSNVRQVEEDSLLDVKNGAYYGHPNAARGEYVLDAGHTADVSADPYQINSYPSGQQPDRNYTRAAFDFGQNVSPDGILQYTAVGSLNKALDGYILVDRYSGGSDILAIKPNADGSVTNNTTNVMSRINGFTQLNSPLDMVEDKTNGNLYVTSLSDEVNAGSITLLKPVAPGSGGGSTGAGTASASRSKISVQVTPGGKGVSQSVTITNTGTGDLVLDRSATKITGTDRKNFGVTNLPTSDYTIAPGATLSLSVIGAIAKGDSGVKRGNLALALNDPSLADGYLIIKLYATASA